MVIVLGIQKKSEKCFNLSSFCDGGLVGFWVGFQRLFWVQLSALDGVAVNPILFLLLFRPYNGILSFNNRQFFFIFWLPAPPPTKKVMVWWFSVFCFASLFWLWIVKWPQIYFATYTDHQVQFSNGCTFFIWLFSFRDKI